MMDEEPAAAGSGDGDGGDEASGSSLGSDEEWVTDSEDDEGGGGGGGGDGGGGGGGGLPGTDALTAILAAGGPLNQEGILAAQAAMAAMFQGFVHPSVSAQEGKNQTEWERIREDAQWAPGKLFRLCDSLEEGGRRVEEMG